MATNPLQTLIGNQAYDDLCEKFAEQQIYGHASMYPNAITAWTSQSKYQKSGLAGIQPGDQLFFSPNEGNGMNGHTGIFKGYDAQGNPLMESATDNGVQISNITNWLKGTGQQLLGYIQTSNPKLKQELTSFANQATQTLGWGKGNPAGPANAQGDQMQQISQQQQDAQNALAQQQKQEQEQADAGTAMQWFNQYKQQQQQQFTNSLPTQGQNYNYTPIQTSQPTQAENWLSSYTG